jgi:hypothetical protein
MCVWLAIFATKLATTSSFDGSNYAAGWLLNRHDYKSLALYWHLPLSLPLRPTNSYWVLKNCTKNAYSIYWQPVYSLIVLSFESNIFEKSQFLSHHYTGHWPDSWHRSIAFQRFWPEIYGITLHALVLDIHSLTSSPCLIQLIPLDFHYRP